MKTIITDLVIDKRLNTVSMTIPFVKALSAVDDGFFVRLFYEHEIKDSYGPDPVTYVCTFSLRQYLDNKIITEQDQYLCSIYSPEGILHVYLRKLPDVEQKADKKDFTSSMIAEVEHIVKEAYDSLDKTVYTAKENFIKLSKEIKEKLK